MMRDLLICLSHTHGSQGARRDVLDVCLSGFTICELVSDTEQPSAIGPNWRQRGGP